jgi:lipoyl synthase
MSIGAPQPLPSWFRQEVPDASALKRMKELLRPSGLHTVCEGARCPNLGGCWGRKTATFMILGDTCTRSCRFCAVKSGVPLAVNLDEPVRVAEAVYALGLKYVVITSVTRDDLPDEGAGHFASVIRKIKAVVPGVVVEALVPDFSAREALIQMVLDSGVDVFGHNIETVRRMSSALRSRADHDRSLQTLKLARRHGKALVKSGLMAGLGERDEEVLGTLLELRQAGCDLVTIGQYLAPSVSARHMPVARFVRPEVFETYRKEALAMGFKFAASAPLVRSSYLAEEGYIAAFTQRVGV